MQLPRGSKRCGISTIRPILPFLKRESTSCVRQKRAQHIKRPPHRACLAQVAASSCRPRAPLRKPSHCLPASHRARRRQARQTPPPRRAPPFRAVPPSLPALGRGPLGLAEHAKITEPAKFGVGLARTRLPPWHTDVRSAFCLDRPPLEASPRTPPRISGETEFLLRSRVVSSWFSSLPTQMSRPQPPIIRFPNRLCSLRLRLSAESRAIWSHFSLHEKNE